MEKKEWKLISHSHQIADTGDYDGYYELTNGDISLVTKDDLPEMWGDALCELLNEAGAKWENWDLDNAKFELHMWEDAAKQWKKVATELEAALWSWIKADHIHPTENGPTNKALRLYKEANKNLPG